MATRITLDFVNRYRDRHGKWRHYFRRPGQKQVALPGMPGSKEFMAAYEAAAGAEPVKVQPGKSRVTPYSMNALIVEFYQSVRFRDLRPGSQKQYRALLEQFRVRELKPGLTYGEIDARHYRPKDLAKIVQAMHDTPAQANHLLSLLRAVFRLAIQLDWITANPAREVDRPKLSKDGIAPWSEEDIATYEAYWPSGTRQRLAMALLLYTGQRRSDVHTMGRQHLKDGRIHVKQIKTDKRLAIRIHSALQAEVDQVPETQLTFILTDYGKPFSAAGFSIWLKKMAAQAGVPDRSPHGLRKAAGRRLAEAGCSAKQIMAILGHDTLKEAERYTRDADQERLGDDAIEKLEQGKPGTKTA